MFTHVPARDLIRGHLRRPGIGRHHPGALGDNAPGRRRPLARRRRASPGDHRPGGQRLRHGGGRITVIALDAALVAAAAAALIDRAQGARREE